MNVKLQENGQIGVSLKETDTKGNKITYKNGETVTAVVNVNEIDENSQKLWETPIKVTLKVKVSTVEPKIQMKQTAFNLNKQAYLETVSTTLNSNQNSVEILDNKEQKWEVAFDNGEIYEPINDNNHWLKLDYEKATKTLSVSMNHANVKAGTYKFEISNVLKGYENASQIITVKVLDKAPTVKIVTTGKLDLISKSTATLGGKVTFSNTVSTVIQKVEVLNAVGKKDNRFKATVITDNTFRLALTEVGMQDDTITTANMKLPIRITLLGGTTIDTTMTVKPVQSVPKITVPVAKTIRKAVKDSTVTYDLGTNLAEGVEIKEIQIVSEPKGIKATVKDDYVLIRLTDKGLRTGTYSVSVKVYCYGAENKPVTKNIQVKVQE